MTPVERNAAILPPPGAAGESLATPKPAAPAKGRAFQDLLARQVSEVTFSRHALERLGRRGIALDQATLGRLDAGVRGAAAKGARDAVVLVDKTAFVVAVPSSTVVTAVDTNHMKDRIFTNIDSAVIA